MPKPGSLTIIPWTLDRCILCSIHISAVTLHALIAYQHSSVPLVTAGKLRIKCTRHVNFELISLTEVTFY